jgi:tetratricopeptide (TPR) repeat protein
MSLIAARAVGATIIALVVAARVASAQAVPMPMSHDMHDSASTAPVLGTIDFPTKANAASHAAFVRGVLLMHNFHYPEAAGEFQKAEALDPTDVMGYWGEAMTYSHPVWNQQDTAAAHRALMKLAPTREARLALARTRREREWLESAEALYARSGTKAQRDTAWSRALEKMHAENPRDDEATTFYALSLLGLNQSDREPVAYQKAYELVLPVFRAHPHHPGAAHYLIHATDDPEHAALGLKAAKAYAGIAPSAGHAIHMTSHIFLALGKWDDVVAANRRAQNVVPDKSLAGHVVHWLHYGLIEQGRYLEADKWLDSIVKQARAPKSRKYGSWDAAGLMAAANLADTRRWSGIAGKVVVDTTRFIEMGTPDAFGDLAAIDFGFALGALQRGEMSAFERTLTRMAERRSAPAMARDPLMATYRGMSEVMEKSLRAYALEKSGDSARALRLFREAADEEAKLPMPFGPPMTIKPPRESAGELLLAMKKPAEAKKEFEMALARTPRRTAALLGLARSEWALGDRAGARKIYRELVGIWHAADAEFPELAEARGRAR